MPYVPVSATATLLSIAALHWAAMVSPGPNVLLVAQTAMSESRRAALAAAAGVASGAVVLTTAALLGLGFVVEQVDWARTVLRVAGAAYLVYLGVQIWRSASDPPAIGRPQTDDRGGWRDYRRGLLTNLTNPKAALFFGSILTPTLAAGASGWVAPAAVVLIFVDALVWHCLLAVLFARPGIQRGYARAKRTIDRVVGAALVLLGVRLGTSA
jgi:threonine efflux protein